MAIALLGIIVLLAPAIVAQTVSQVVVGVSLTSGEILAPVVGFIILGLVAIWLEVSLLRNIVDHAQQSWRGDVAAETSLP